MVRGVTVRFQSQGSGDEGYSFKTLLSVKYGDFVVVETSRGYQIAQVVQIRSAPDTKSTKWAFATVDLDALEKCKEVGEKYDELVSNLEARLEEQSSLSRYELLAQIDPEARKMLDQLEMIVGRKPKKIAPRAKKPKE